MNIRENKGITLILLIIIIVVILILASVSISAITGGEGIIEKGKQAKDETEITAEMEELQKIINQSATKGIRHGNYSGSADAITIRDALKTNNLIVENPDDVIIDGKNYWKVTGLKTGQKYKIKSDGTVEKYRSLLPDDFQQVEYIESTGTQYIDTKVIPNGNEYTVEIDFQITKNLNNTWLFGTDKLECGIYYGRLWNSETTGFSYSSTNILDRMTGYSKKNILDTKSFRLFARNFIGLTSETRPACVKIFSAKIFENDKIIRYFIPCYCITNVIDVYEEKCTDGTRGMYDIVENKFYTNEGSETFIKGNDV